MDRPPPRTLLEQLVRSSRRTVGETCLAFEQTARDHGEKATLSSRHLSRWMAGNIGTARPVAQRVAALHWGYDFERLVGPPRTGMEPATPAEQSIAADAPDWPAWFGIRLGHLIGTVDGWTGAGASLDILQDLLNREVMMFDAAGEYSDRSFIQSRRQALISIAALPLTLAVPATGLSSTAAIDFFLARSAASLTACWHLLRGNNLPAVAHVLSAYLLELEAIVCREPKFRAAAAQLASQAHRICGIVALHRDQLSMREQHCLQALHYANATSDPSSQASALISLASTYFYGRSPTRAASVYERALAIESALPPLQRSRIHAELSVVYAQLGRERDALTAAELADALYPRQPEQDPSFLYAEFTAASLALELGLCYIALAERLPARDNPRLAANALARVERGQHRQTPDRIRFEVLGHQARVAVMLNDIDAFATYIGRATDGVITLASRQRQREVQAAWASAAERWPNERRLKSLGDQMRTAITAKPVGGDS